MLKVTEVSVVYVQLSACAGSSISECLREAIAFAATEWVNVHLLHNERTYKILVNDLMDLAVSKT
jgi:hypothetical protein